MGMRGDGMEGWQSFPSWSHLCLFLILRVGDLSALTHFSDEEVIKEISVSGL